jgi:NAD(P)-dependent dehydrogenase (short-subunit alcohol dehydrogenase family)
MAKAPAFSFGLEGKCAWIVGASGAIGSAIAQSLAANGVTVFLSGRNEAKLNTLRDNLLQDDCQASVIVLDAKQAYQVDHTAKEIMSRLGRLDILVNSTTTSTFGEFLELSDDNWEECFQSKLMVYVRTMRAVLPFMLAAGSGSIVNISGKAGKLPSPAHLAGGSMNAAVNLLTKGISDRYGSSGVRANTVAPGPIISERFNLLAEKLEASPSANPKFMAKHGTPDDVANAVLWLVSQHASHLNGIVLPLDGGAMPTI